MLSFAAAALFSIAFLINATSAATSAVFSPTSLLRAGLACLRELCQGGHHRPDGYYRTPQPFRSEPEDLMQVAATQ
jgi:hypothetical protein